MARLLKLPEQAIISGFKGVIDFYLWKGIPCARKWPRWKLRAPYALEASNQADFSYVNKLWATLPQNVQDSYREMAVGTPWTGKDLLVISYMSGINYS